MVDEIQQERRKNPARRRNASTTSIGIAEAARQDVAQDRFVKSAGESFGKDQGGKLR